MFNKKKKNQFTALEIAGMANTVILGLGLAAKIFFKKKKSQDVNANVTAKVEVTEVKDEKPEAEVKKDNDVYPDAK